MKPLDFGGRALIICAAVASLSGCGGSQSPSSTADALSIQVRCHHAGRSEVKLWQCMNRAEHHGFIDLVLTPEKGIQHSPDSPREVSPGLVRDGRTGLKGSIDYKGATMLTVDRENGLFLIPVHLANGEWAILVWKVRGEFQYYVGAKKL